MILLSKYISNKNDVIHLSIPLNHVLVLYIDPNSGNAYADVYQGWIRRNYTPVADNYTNFW